MGLFSRKKDAGSAPSSKSSSQANLKRDLVPCDKIILAPPENYPRGNVLVKLTPAQASSYNVLLEHYQDPDLRIPTNTNADCTDLKQLSSWEKFWITRECILRYLRAAKWDTTHAIKNMTETLVWRRETGLTHDPMAKTATLSPDKVAVENETGKEVVLGFDKERRPLFYMKNGRQNTEPSFRQVQHMIYMMESAVTMCPQGVEKVTVLVDFKLYKEAGIISDKAPPISIARACLNVLQNHYPERLAKCILINMPWYIWAFLKMMYPFLDPATKEKAIFDEPFEKHIEPEQLEALYNGKLDFTYKHDVYWPSMVEATETIRKQHYDRFVKFGSVVGLSEFDFKGDHDELIYPVDFDMTKL